MSIMQDNREAGMLGTRTDGSAIKRPLSPHMQAYDMLQMTSLTSILTRISGMAWSVGILLLVWWLVAAAAGPVAFSHVAWFLTSWLGLLVLFGMTAAVWWHTLGGIRHIVWDLGYGMDIPNVYRWGRAMFALTAGLTLLTWAVGLYFWR